MKYYKFYLFSAGIIRLQGKGLPTVLPLPSVQSFLRLILIVDVKFVPLSCKFCPPLVRHALHVTSPFPFSVFRCRCFYALRSRYCRRKIIIGSCDNCRTNPILFVISNALCCITKKKVS